jgi:hypothetical protein
LFFEIEMCEAWQTRTILVRVTKLKVGLSGSSRRTVRADAAHRRKLREAGLFLWRLPVTTQKGTVGQGRQPLPLTAGAGGDKEQRMSGFDSQLYSDQAGVATGPHRFCWTVLTWWCLTE